MNELVKPFFKKKQIQKKTKKFEKQETWFKQKTGSRMNYEWIGKTS